MRRNVLFLMVDCMRADILWDRQRYPSLPNIDALKARSSSFTEMITAATTTTPNGELGGVAKLKEAHPAVYQGLSSFVFPAFDDKSARVPAGSADVVLTFRNVHNWIMPAEPFGEEAFRQMFAMLKPGGTLGVVEHRLPESADSAREKTSGYIKVSTVRRLAEGAGFRLVASSEINANPADTKDHPNGVWSLPPTLRGGDKDRDRFLAVGESDRMTLKFVKPGR